MAVESMSAKARIHYFDIAKGIAIICVIIGHFGISSINQVVFSFHMPLFFLISGYFLKIQVEWKEFTVQKAKQLIVPYVTTAIFVAVGAVLYQVYETRSLSGALDLGWNWIKAGIYGAGSQGTGLPEGIWAIGAIWFLLALFVALIEVRFLVPRKYGVVFIAILSYMACVSRQYIWLPFSVQMGAFCAVFVYMGLKAKEYDVFNMNIPSWVKCLGLAVWGLYIAYCRIFSAVQGVLSNGLLDFIVPVIGSYFVIELAKIIDRKTNYLSRVLEFYGKNTLIILCAHLFELNVFPWGDIWAFLAEDCGFGFYTQVWIIIIFKIIWATLAVVVINRMPVLKDIYQGHGLSFIKEDSHKQSRMSKNEENWCKPLMGAAVLLMILGYDILKEQGRGEMYSVAVTMIIFTIGIRISGKRAGRKIKKGLQDLMIPYLFLSVLTVLIQTGYILADRKTVSQLIDSVISLAGAMSASCSILEGVAAVPVIWIFPCMFLSLCIYSIVHNIFGSMNSELKTVFLVLLSLLGCVLGSYVTFMPWSFDLALAMIVFVWIGDAFLSKRHSAGKERLAVLISGVITLDLLVFKTSYNVIGRDYSCIPFGLVLGGAAGIFVILLVKYVCKINWLLFCFESIGRFSPVIIGIYYLENVFWDWRTKLGEMLSVEVTPYRAWVIRIIVISLIVLVYGKKRNLICWEMRNE